MINAIAKLIRKLRRYFFIRNMDKAPWGNELKEDAKLERKYGTKN